MDSSMLAKASLIAAPLAFPLLYNSTSSFLNNFVSKRTTVLHDLPDLGKPRPDGRRIQGTAVVCGGSFAGLWSARVLSDHYEDVVIVEPEAWLVSDDVSSESSDSDENSSSSPRKHSRSRVFQYTACHILHPISYHALKLVFPNIDDEVGRIGGRIARANYHVHIGGGRIKFNEPDQGNKFADTLFLSRDGYECLLRRLVISNTPRIRWMTGTAVNVELADDDNTTISSVTVRSTDGSEQAVPASLVVDCSGTTQAGLKWLKRARTEVAKRTEKPIASNVDDLRLSYATVQQTRTYNFYIPRSARSKLSIPGGYTNATWIYTILPLMGKGNKSIYVDRIEGHRIRMMFGIWGDQPLPDFDDIITFVRSFNGDEKAPEWLITLIEEILEFREGATVSSCKYPRLSWIRYENSDYLPRNFVAVGDSVMQANPTFGQGLAKVAINAIALDHALRSVQVHDGNFQLPIDFSRNFFKDITNKTLLAWEGTKSVDYLFDTTTPAKGEKLSDSWLKSKAILTVLLLSREDDDVGSKLWKSISFTDTFTPLISPSILLKAFRYYMTHRIEIC